MQALFFYTFYVFSWLLAQLPFRVIYILSDLLAFIMYRIAGYRRTVVRENLHKSFPEKSLKEIIAIEKKFYTHFADLFLEDIIMLHASKRRVLKMCKFVNPEILDQFYDKQKSVILALGHYGNWELMSLISAHIKHIALGVYKPLANKRFERLLNSSRMRFGGVPVAMNDAFKTVISRVKAGDLVLLGLISDQTPASGDIRYWTNFLNQDTPVFLGVEKIAAKLDLPVLFSKMRKVSRGRYELTFEVLCTNPKSFAQYELTNLHVQVLENQIIEQPEHWLWSHRRWKRKRNTVSNE